MKNSPIVTNCKITHKPTPPRPWGTYLKISFPQGSPEGDLGWISNASSTESRPRTQCCDFDPHPLPGDLVQYTASDEQIKVAGENSKNTDAFPALMRPSFLNTGFSLANDSGVVGRGCSST